MQRYQEEQIDLKRQLKARYPEIIANAKVVLGNSFRAETIRQWTSC
jgi:hypothetical protein